MKTLLTIITILVLVVVASPAMAQDGTQASVPAGLSAGALFQRGVTTNFAWCAELGKEDVYGLTGIVSYMYVETDEAEYNYLKVFGERPLSITKDLWIIPGGGFWQLLNEFGSDRSFPAYSIGLDWHKYGFSLGARAEVAVRTGSPDMYYTALFFRKLL
jgi:hypothetical protein